MTPDLDLPADWKPCGELRLLESQLRAIDAWNRARRMAEVSNRAVGVSRETRMDLTRRMEVLRREHEAIIASTEERLRPCPASWGPVAAPRAVVAHHNEWFTGRLVGALTDRGVEVLAQLDNGADAVGVCVAEQPDLLLVEECLPMMGGEAVIRQVLVFAPATIAAAQTEAIAHGPALLDAGARAAFARSVPPQEVARELCLLLGP